MVGEMGINHQLCNESRGAAARITQNDNAITMTTGNATKKGQPETTTCWRSREVYRVSLGRERERGMGKKGAIGV